MIGALIVVFSILVLFNSLMCARILKRFQPELNDYLSLTYGFFLFIAFIQLMFIPIVASHNQNPKFILFYLLGIQVVCLIAYAINWRFSLMKIYMDYKSLLIIFLGILICVGIFFGLKQYGTQINQYYHDKLQNYYQSLTWSTNVFQISNLTSIYLMEAINGSFGLLFRITNMYLIYEYMWIIIFSVIISFGIYGMYFYTKENKWWSILTFILICAIIAVCSFVIVGSASNGNAWILFTIIVLFQAHLDNVKRVKYEIGIIHINYLSLGLFCLAPSSIYAIIITNICLSMLSYIYKRNNATDYNILTLFGTVLSVSIYLFLYNFIIGTVFTVVSLLVYIIYLFIRKTYVVTQMFGKINNMSSSTIKIISFGVAVVILLIAVFLMTISTKFDFDESPWVITYFLNKNLNNQQALYWIVNSCWWSLNIVIIVYAILGQFANMKLQKYIENAKLTPIILINSMTVWNPISSNLWLKIANSNALMVQNAFLVNLSATGINFIYYLINKNKMSRSLVILGGLTTLTVIGLVLVNVLV